MNTDDWLMQWTEHQIIEKTMMFEWEVGAAIRRGGAVASVFWDDCHVILSNGALNSTRAERVVSAIWGGPDQTDKTVLFAGVQRPHREIHV